jgi:hypothetical protein
MLKPPRDAREALGRLAPDLEEIADFINNCPLTAPERIRLANLLSDHFHGLAASFAVLGPWAAGKAAAAQPSGNEP